MKHVSILLLLLLLALPLPAFAADPPAKPPAPNGDIILPHVVLPTPPPPPAPQPGAVQKLLKGQWYIIDAPRPLLVDGFGLPDGKVTVAFKKGPLVVPAEIAVGRDPDKDDPDLCTIAGPFVYVIKAQASGLAVLDVLPALNLAGADGKPVPFTAADVIRRTLDVDAGDGPRPPPVPPPGPGPVPPPVPPPSPAPIPAEGNRVLMIYETGDVTKYPAAQQSVMYSKSVRDWLDSKCALGADGKTKEWRIWDKDIDAMGETKLWQDALARKRDSTPWIIISNGKTGYEGPLPANVADAMMLFKKYFGD